MPETIKQPETAALLEPLVGPWYSREDGACLVRQYMGQEILAEVFWSDQLNAAFAKGCQVGSGQAEEKLFPVFDRLQERLERGCKIAFQDDRWHLFAADGNGIVSGETLRQMLFALVFAE